MPIVFHGFPVVQLLELQPKSDIAKMKLAQWLIFKVFIIQTPNIQFPCCFPEKETLNQIPPDQTATQNTHINTGPQPEIIRKIHFNAFQPSLLKPRGILWIPTCWDVYSSCTSPLKTRSQRWSAFGSAPCEVRRCERADGAFFKSTVKCVVYETPVCSSIIFDVSAIL